MLDSQLRSCVAPLVDSGFQSNLDSCDFPLTDPPVADPLQTCLSAIAIGDRSAMMLFHSKTLSWVVAASRRVLWTKEDAEEIVYDVYVWIWLNSTAYNSARGSVRAWLSGITRNRAIDRLRLRGRGNYLSLDDAGQSGVKNSLLAVNLSADDSVAQSQSADALHSALKCLSPLRRQLIALAFFDGLTHEEIATVVGMPLGTIKSHLRRTLASLQSTLLSHQPV